MEFGIKVTDKDECEQFLNLISHVHDNHSRIVVVCKNKDDFYKLINEEFHYQFSSFTKDEQKLRDRIRVIMHDKEKIFQQEDFENKNIIVDQKENDIFIHILLNASEKTGLTTIYTHLH